MREQLLVLYELQELDIQIRGFDERIRLIPTKANAAKVELEQAQKALKEAKGRRDEAERERRRQDMELAGERDKIKKWEARLNDIKNSREFMALQRETEALKKQNRDTEEQILGHMQKAEDASKEVETLAAEVAKLDAAYNALDKEAREACAAVDAESVSVRNAREVLAQRAKPNLLKQYNMVRQKRAGVGLALVIQGICKACHMQLPPQMYNELQRCNSIIACPTCNRILFFEPLAHRTTEDQAGIQP